MRFLFVSKAKRMFFFVKESFKEIVYKVEWFSYDKLCKYAVSVLFCSVLLSILVTITDLTIKFVIGLIYS